MILRPCPHETEIKRLLELGHWPHSCPTELRAHAAACRSCGDLIRITQAMRSARAASMGAAQLPPPGVLWWRAQLRRRNAAVERIQRPILGAYLFAFAVTVLLAAGVAVSQAKPGIEWLSSIVSSMASWTAFWVSELPKSQAFHLQSLFWQPTAIKLDASLLYLAPGIAMLALLGGVVVYLASEKQ